ncbi:sugar transferase [Roseovarius sp. 2305UL8-3]|uniref:sugar transferase n=1 Tax=Roseovarius conchicola TaxID=3121636 RepID=UPI003529A403
MTFSKRLMDICLALFFIVLLSPLILYVAFRILIADGRPILYRSERMKTPDQAFMLWKFRTMTTAAEDSGVSGGDKSSRITPLGARLRHYRADEMPQLLNILRGDISFVGPRPPLRRYVELCPELYAEVLKCRPGVTGLASLIFHKTEERLLAACHTAQDTEAVYLRRCVPVKAKLDLIYARNQSACYDGYLIWRTITRVLKRA